MFCFCNSPILGRRFSTAPHSMLISKPAVNTSKLSLCSWFGQSQRDVIQPQSSLDKPRTFALDSTYLSIEDNTTNLVVCDSNTSSCQHRNGIFLSSSICFLMWASFLCRVTLCSCYGIRCFSRQQRRCLNARFHFYTKSFHCLISSCITLTSTLSIWRTCQQFMPLLDEAVQWWISITDSQMNLLYITLQWVSLCFSQNLKVDMFHQYCIHASSLHTLANPNGHRNGSPLQRRYWRMSGQIITR